MDETRTMHPLGGKNARGDRLSRTLKWSIEHPSWHTPCKYLRNVQQRQIKRSQVVRRPLETPPSDAFTRYRTRKRVSTPNTHSHSHTSSLIVFVFAFTAFAHCIDSNHTDYINEQSSSSRNGVILPSSGSGAASISGVHNTSQLSSDDNRRSIARLSVLNFETSSDSSSQTDHNTQNGVGLTGPNSSSSHRPLHFRSYHFAKVLLLPVSGRNASLTLSASSTSSVSSSKHGSIKRKRSGRYRRLSSSSTSSLTSSSALASLHAFHPKSKSGGVGQIPGLGPLSSSSLPGQGRLKILPGTDVGAPSPFGPVVPDSKCNYELYPGGCFDENGSVCDGSARRCVCRPGHSIQLEGLYCLRPATIGEACYTTEQCERRVAHSGCFNYREEYRLEHPSAFFGPAQSSWPMGECRCRAGYRYEPTLGACTPALIGAWCSNAWDCQDPSWLEGGGAHHHSSGSKGASSAHSGSYSHHSSHNRSSSSSSSSTHHSSSSNASGGGGAHRKAANVICDGNVCACASFFHFNESAIECQYRETYGRHCKPHTSSSSSQDSSGQSASVTPNSGGSDSSGVSPPSGPPIKCNPPSVCSVNGTCVCPDNFEFQPNSRPQCQRYKGQSSANLFGTSGRSGKGSDSYFDFDRPGSSSLANFAEYVLYVLVPALIIIFAARPCVRRIGEWRNHVHHYASDADFFQGFSRPVMSIAEMNALQTATEKGIPSAVGASTSGAFAPFDPCHAPYLFDSAALVDSCFGYPPAAHSSAYGHHRPSLGPNDPSLALVREKLQTIEESQSESGVDIGAGAAASAASTAVCRCGAVGVNCCGAPIVEDCGEQQATCSGEQISSTKNSGSEENSGKSTTIHSDLSNDGDTTNNAANDTNSSCINDAQHDALNDA